MQELVTLIVLASAAALLISWIYAWPRPSALGWDHRAVQVSAAVLVVGLMVGLLIPDGDEAPVPELVAAVKGTSTSDQAATASGKVLDTEGKPVSGASVRATGPLFTTGVAQNFETFTTPTGDYRIELIEGAYNLFVSAAGFEPSFRVALQDLPRISGDAVLPSILMKRRDQIEVRSQQDPGSRVVRSGTTRQQVPQLLMSHGIIVSPDEIASVEDATMGGEGWTAFVRDGQSVSTQDMTYFNEPAWLVRFTTVDAMHPGEFYVQKVCGNPAVPAGVTMPQPIPKPADGPVAATENPAAGDAVNEKPADQPAQAAEPNAGPASDSPPPKRTRRPRSGTRPVQAPAVPADAGSPAPAPQPASPTSPAVSIPGIAGAPSAGAPAAGNPLVPAVPGELPIALPTGTGNLALPPSITLPAVPGVSLPPVPVGPSGGLPAVPGVPGIALPGLPPSAPSVPPVNVTLPPVPVPAVPKVAPGGVSIGLPIGGVPAGLP